MLHRLATNFIKYYPFDHSKDRTIIGLAAGFDKNCELLSYIHKLGFAFAEVGSLTPKENKGNKPKILKFDNSMINNFGLPNIGIDKAIPKLQKAKPKIPILANVSPLQDTTFKEMQNSVSILQRTCISAIVLNISCPNIHCDELRTDLLKIKSYKPIFIKLAPNLSHGELIEIVSDTINNRIRGFVLTNSMPTTNGGLSGRNLKDFSNATIRVVNKLKSDDQIIIGCGGIETSDDIIEKRNLGADCVELLTSWILSKNPWHIHNLNHDLNSLGIHKSYPNQSQPIGKNLELKLNKIKKYD